MATLTQTTPVSTTGTALGAVSAASGGDQFLNDGRCLLYVKNTNAATRTVTVVTSASVGGGLSIGDIAFTVAQNEEKLIGPFPPRYFNDGNGYVQLTYSGVASLLTVAVIRLM